MQWLHQFGHTFSWPQNHSCPNQTFEYVFFVRKCPWPIGIEVLVLKTPRVTWCFSWDRHQTLGFGNRMGQRLDHGTTWAITEFSDFSMIFWWLLLSNYSKPRKKIWFQYGFTSSTAQGGGGSFNDRKPIGKDCCCDAWMSEWTHWWTERPLMLWVSLSLSLSINIYIYIYIHIYIYVCVSIYPSIRLSVYLSFFLSMYPSIYLSLYLAICLSNYRSIYLSVYLTIWLLTTSLSINPSLHTRCLSIYRPIYLYLYPPAYLPPYLSIYWSVFISFFRSCFLSI